MNQQEIDTLHNKLDSMREEFERIVNTDPNKAKILLAQYLDLIASNHKKLKHK